MCAFLRPDLLAGRPSPKGSADAKSNGSDSELCDIGRCIRDTSPIVEIRVTGTPQPGGSKRAFFHKASGRAIITDANPKAKKWMTAVAEAAIAAYDGEPLDGALRVSVIFILERPLFHFGTGKNSDKLKPSAPFWSTSKPDATKLWRSTEDALTGIFWKDDARIAEQVIQKRYAGYGEKAGVIVKLWRLE